MQTGNILNFIIAFAAGAAFVFLSQKSTEKCAIPRYQKVDSNCLSSNRKSSVGRSQYTELYKPLTDISKDLKNYWLYFNSLVRQTSLRGQITTIDDGYISINNELTKLIRLSHADRAEELNRLAQDIRDKLERLQNRIDCDKANLLLCDIDNHCGFGCSLHTTVGCLMRAYLTNRTMVFRSKNWQYAKEGWEYAFLPLGNCKNETDIELIHRMIINTDDILQQSKKNRVLSFNSQRVSDISWKIPSEIAPTLMKIHGQPYAWWVSQFVAYIFRLNSWYKSKLDNVSKKIGFQPSAAGIHVRWGDKTQKEAGKHIVDEYMYFVEKWFKQLEMEGSKPKRVVYVAYEDPDVLVLLKHKYPNYHFLTSRFVSKVVQEEDRYTHSGLESIIIDIYFLSKSDYLVCTQTSSVCRTAYELMLNNHLDVSSRFQTLDSFYTLKTSIKQTWIATMNHVPIRPDEIGFHEGDEIILQLKPPTPPFNDGFFSGVKKGSIKKGRFPLFKLREKYLHDNS